MNESDFENYIRKQIDFNSFVQKFAISATGLFIGILLFVAISTMFAKLFIIILLVIIVSSGVVMATEARRNKETLTDMILTYEIMKIRRR